MKRITMLTGCLCLMSLMTNAQKLYVGSGLVFSQEAEDLANGLHPALYVDYEGSFTLKHKWVIGLSWNKLISEAYNGAYDYDENGEYVICNDCDYETNLAEVNLNYLVLTPSYRYEYNTAGALDFGWAMAIPISTKMSYQEPTMTIVNEGGFNEHTEAGAPFTSHTENVNDQYGLLTGPSFTFTYKFNRVITGINFSYLLGKMPRDPVSKSDPEEVSIAQFQLRLGYRLF